MSLQAGVRVESGLRMRPYAAADRGAWDGFPDRCPEAAG
jgi:hypothetical protein